MTDYLRECVSIRGAASGHDGCLLIPIREAFYAGEHLMCKHALMAHRNTRKNPHNRWYLH